MSDATKRAKLKYREKIEQLRVDLFPTDQDVIDRIAERVANGEPKATYIKRLIREDIQRIRK